MTIDPKDPTQDMFTDLREINDAQKQFIKELRWKATDLLKLFEQIPNCRRKSIAITELEQCVMFATKAICYGN